MLTRFGTFGTIAVILLGLVCALSAMQNNQYTGAGMCLLAAGLGSAVAMYFSSRHQ